MVVSSCCCCCVLCFDTLRCAASHALRNILRADLRVVASPQCMSSSLLTSHPPLYMPILLLRWPRQAVGILLQQQYDTAGMFSLTHPFISSSLHPSSTSSLHQVITHPFIPSVPYHCGPAASEHISFSSSSFAHLILLHPALSCLLYHGP